MPKSCSNHFTGKKEACSLPATVMTANHLLRARRFLWGSCAAMVLVIQLGGASQAALTRANTQFEALPLVRSRQNHLLVHAFINGRPAWLTVDSGAPVSAIALNRREYFRLKPITAKSSLPARVQINGAFNNVAIARELRIGGLILADEPVVTVDLGGSARAARMAHEPQIDGIIGPPRVTRCSDSSQRRLQLVCERFRERQSGKTHGRYRFFHHFVTSVLCPEHANCHSRDAI